jgi:ribosome modulation factor
MLLDNNPTPKPLPENPTAEGMRARALGRGRELCPYPLHSEERHEWLEGFDGVGAEGAPLVPEARTDRHRT